MDERSKVLLASLTGAVLGAAWGCLYLTEAGRRFRQQVEPTLDAYLGELRRVRGTVDKAKDAVDESWRTVSEIASGESRWGSTSGRSARP